MDTFFLIIDICDNMEKIWSPWRSEYINSFSKEKSMSNESKESCFICDAALSNKSNENNLLIYKTNLSIVLMNKFPYNNGHLLISPINHLADITDLNKNVQNELMSLMNESVKIIKKIYKPHGYNLGLNSGIAGGAGLPGHLHFHLVPRWNGDTNFMSTIGDLKIISESIQDSRLKLISEFDKL